MPWRSEQLPGEVTDALYPLSMVLGDHVGAGEVDHQPLQLAHHGVGPDYKLTFRSAQTFIDLLLHPRVLGGVEDSNSCLECVFPVVEKLVI